MHQHGANSFIPSAIRLLNADNSRFADIKGGSVIVVVMF